MYIEAQLFFLLISSFLNERITDESELQVLIETAVRLDFRLDDFRAE